MSLTRLLLVGLLCSCGSSVAGAATFEHAVCTTVESGTVTVPDVPAASRSAWDVTFGAPVAFDQASGSSPDTPSTIGASSGAQSTGADQTAARPRAFEYSHGYEVRRKIHVYASVATLPLFATQVILGEKLYNGSSSGVKSAHSAVATGIGVLFGVNTVTGVWNLLEARKDPNHRRLTTIHGIMMLAADAGFVATGLLAPNSEDPNSFVNDRGPHRTVAYTSMGVAAASYLLMLFGNK